MTTFEIIKRNAEDQDEESCIVNANHLSLWFGRQLAEVIINQSNLSDFHFKLTLETDTVVYSVTRQE